MAFEKKGSTMNGLVYGDWYSGGVWERVKGTMFKWSRAARCWTATLTWFRNMTIHFSSRNAKNVQHAAARLPKTSGGSVEGTGAEVAKRANFSLRKNPAFTRS